MTGLPNCAADCVAHVRMTALERELAVKMIDALVLVARHDAAIDALDATQWEITAAVNAPLSAEVGGSAIGGRAKGGYARAAKLSGTERSEIARKAALARWAHKKPLRRPAEAV